MPSSVEVNWLFGVDLAVVSFKYIIVDELRIINSNELIAYVTIRCLNKKRFIIIGLLM